MPNWVTNRITGDATSIGKLRARLRSDDLEIDFNRLVKMPAHSAGGFFARGNLSAEEEQAHPLGNWYEWSRRYWGTKWNASLDEHSRQRNTDTVIMFNTAWSCPMPIVFALAAAEPDASWLWEYADEDIGYNLGSFRFAAGVLTIEPVAEERRVAFACEVKGYDARYDPDFEEWDADA